MTLITQNLKQYLYKLFLFYICVVYCITYYPIPYQLLLITFPIWYIWPILFVVENKFKTIRILIGWDDINDHLYKR
jgi:hypothetical protein